MPLISSSSAPARPARRWPTACRKTASNRVLVLEYGGTDWGPLIQMPAALSYPMNMPLTTGASRPSPSRISAAGSWRRRAARSSAARPRSTAWSMCAAMPATSTTGQAMGATGWGFADVLPYFKRHGEFARRRGRLARQRRPAACHPRPAHQSALRGLRRGRARRPASSDRRLQRRSRKASAPWSRPSSTAAAGRPPMPICARRSSGRIVRLLTSALARRVDPRGHNAPPASNMSVAARSSAPLPIARSSSPPAPSTRRSS